MRYSSGRVRRALTAKKAGKVLPQPAAPNTNGCPFANRRHRRAPEATPRRADSHRGRACNAAASGCFCLPPAWKFLQARAQADRASARTSPQTDNARSGISSFGWHPPAVAEDACGTGAVDRAEPCGDNGSTCCEDVAAVSELELAAHQTTKTGHRRRPTPRPSTLAKQWALPAFTYA